MKAEVIYLETCYPDYFQGYNGDTLAVPLSRRPRVGEVKSWLLAELKVQEIGFYCVGRDRMAGDDLDKYLNSETLWEDLTKSVDELFEGSDGRRSWGAGTHRSVDYSESYAYFGIRLVED